VACAVLSKLLGLHVIPFHVFSDEDWRRYVEGLASVLRAGGRLFLLCFSDEEPGTQGPRRVSQKGGSLRRGAGAPVCERQAQAQ
jgi:hypothetical protein